MLKFPYAKPQFFQVAIVMLLGVHGGSATSSSNPQVYSLPWNAKGESLIYRSCGCADECWVAELKTRNSKRFIARLRCDCSSLYVTYPANSVEQKYADSCSALNDRPDKMSEISKEMKTIIERSHTK